jgi:hypothetical protein
VFRILHTHIYTQQLKIALPSFLSRTPKNAMVVWVSAAREAASFRKRVVLSALRLKFSLEVIRATAKQQSNDESEQTEDGREDLNDQDLDETISTLAIFVLVLQAHNLRLTAKGPQHRPKQRWNR